MWHLPHKDKSKKHLQKEGLSWKSFLGVFGYILCAFVFYASQILSPLHIPIALIFLMFAGKKAHALYTEKHIQKNVNLFKKKAWYHIALHRVLLLSCVVLFLVFYTITTLVPNDKEVFSGRDTEEVRTLVADDIQTSAQLIDMLTVTGEQLLSNVALYKKELTPSEQESLKKDWDTFLRVAIASEYVTDTHRYFPQISVFREPELHAQSFTISYALYMKKFEYFHKIIAAVGMNETVRIILNEYSSAFGAKNSYTDVTDRYFATNSFLRRNVGYLYHILINPSASSITSPEYRILVRVAEKSYHYVFSNVFSHITHRGITYTNAFNDTIADSWLPIQKTVFVDTIGNIHVGDRKEKFITVDDIALMRQSLHPGDIFVARKNWYASNVGIPGFWTHAGLYTGTLDEMETYFADIFPYVHTGVTYASFHELLEGAYPEAFRTYSNPDTYGHTPSVIESETKGTNIQSVEHSATVDYFAVMRTSLEKKDILESLLRVFAHQYKPYDYEFNMHTKDEVFCSELVYDAYVTLPEKKGVAFPTSVVTGKEIVSPNDIIKKFVEEDGTGTEELTFVYFLDGSETESTVHVSTKDAFKESFYRPKFSFLQE